MATLQNRSTTNQYEGAQLENLQPTRIVSAQVANNPVLYQYAVSPAGPGSIRGSSMWLPPEGAPLLPGYWTLQAPAAFGGYLITGIRFKSQVAGSPAVVNVNTV